MDTRLNGNRVNRRTVLGGAVGGAAALSLAQWQAKAGAHGLDVNSARVVQRQGQPGGTLIYGLGFDVDGTLDPQVTNYDSTIRVLLNICEPLVWMPTATEFIPGLAESWTISEDGTEYTFVLKQGVTFHDGTPFNAEAVQFTFDRVVAGDIVAAGGTPTVGGTPDASMVIVPGQCHDQLGPYDHSEIIDDYTIKVVLKSAFAPFLAGLNGYLGIVSPTAVRTMGIEAFARAPVGTGPFIFGEWIEADHITVTKNPDYTWGSSAFANTGAAYFDSIEFRVIDDISVRTGTVTTDETQYIDSIDGLQLPDLEANSDVTVIKQAQPGAGQLMEMNLIRQTPIAELAVRQAMHYALDKEALNQAAYGGLNLPANSALMRPTLGYEPMTETLFTYDVAKANQILDEAGWVMNGEVREKNGVPLELYYPLLEREPDKGTATFLQGAWAEVGIKLNLEIMERGRLRQVIREEGNYDITGIWFSYADPDVLRTIFWSQNIGSFNRSNYNVPEVDGWLEQAAATNDQAERTALYSQVQLRVLQDVAIIPMVDTFGYNAKSSRMQGDVLDFLASYVNLNSAYFE